MLFTEVLESMARSGDSWAVRVPADWMQGRSVFGGLQGALLLKAMRALGPTAPLRVMQTTFIAPMGGEARVEARVLRAGKTTVHAEARIVSGGETAAIAIAVFGAGRASEIAVTPRMREAPPHAEPVATEGTRDLPAFLEHFRLRWLQGGPPGTGTPLSEAIVLVDMPGEARASEEHVLAVADATPPIGLSMLKTRVPGSSLTWTIEMLKDGGLANLGLSGWRLDVDLASAGSGYSSQGEIVWGPGGEAVAVSRQCMVVFG